jgi:hypothetical protein
MGRQVASLGKCLRRYELNIGAHWQGITAQRTQLKGHELHMSYFKSLGGLFARSA